jgi:pilin isopeptide linkage protein/LPXTG-motif cell wall-anchored protein
VDQSEYNIKVFVKNNGSGGLEIERVFALESSVDPDNPTEDQKLSSITYNHRYAGDPNPCFIDPPVKKVITGDTPATDETFYFTITAKPDQSTLPEGMTKMPMPEAANGQQSYTMSIVGEGEREFGEIWFSQPGKYVYEITENKGNADGYGYDKSVYTVIADVTMDANGNLHVAQTEKKGLFEADEIVFNNAYDENGGEPKTGDDFRLKLIVGIMIAAAAAIGLLLVTRRRRRDEEE